MREIECCRTNNEPNLMPSMCAILTMCRSERYVIVIGQSTRCSMERRYVGVYIVSRSSGNPITTSPYSEVEEHRHEERSGEESNESTNDVGGV